jgi:hypothetical protein
MTVGSLTQADVTSAKGLHEKAGGSNVSTVEGMERRVLRVPRRRGNEQEVAVDDRNGDVCELVAVVLGVVARSGVD